MHPNLRWIRLALAVACCAAVACGASDDRRPDDDAGGGEDPFASSPRALVKFKGAVRLRNDLMAALALEQSELCNELGLYSCTDDVHAIALGGVSPYELALYEPLPNTTATTPLAIDRVVLHACRERTDRDLADPGAAVLLRDVRVAGGALDPTADASIAAIDRLYKRGVQRPPSAEEVAHLQALYGDVAAASETPARDWAILSCFAVLTTTEFLFY